MSANAKPACARVSDQRAGEQHPARAEPVDQQPHRDLHAGVDQELQHRERRELGGRDVESVGRGQAGDRERRAVEDREQVDQQADEPDRVRTAVPDVGGLAHRSSLDRPAAPSVGQREARIVQDRGDVGEEPRTLLAVDDPVVEATAPAW